MTARRLLTLALPLSLVTAGRATAQSLSSGGGRPAAATTRPATAGATSATATRAATAPAIDGRDDDAVWREAQVIDEFQVFQPTEGGTPRLRTTVRVSFDDKNVYVFTRMYDPHPDSVVSLLSRRDVRTPSDQIKVIIDSYHDRRTGYEFAVNPAGVQRDYSIYNDNQEDDSWDGVWEVATRIDSVGWTAEYRIPLSQLRFAKSDSHTFGFAVWRDVARYNERYSWPLYKQSGTGLASQLGEIAGIDGIGSARRFEVTPYTVSKSLTTQEPGPGSTTLYGTKGEVTGGADVKYGVTSNLTIDATLNPDFGQVESDPAVLNLSAFETFLSEKRPFFLEGNGIFSFDMNCNDGQCNGLFYSRRIGRQPQLGGLSSDPGLVPSASTILGAAKLTGRLQSGLSVGLLDAVTQRETVGDTLTVEPRTNYLVGRLQQDFRKGQSGVGVMVTGVNRSLDAVSADYLRSSAYAGGLDFRHRFYKGQYEISGWAVGSTLRGDSSAIALTQQSPVHYYQRPDGGLRYDSSRTSLQGDAEQVSFNKLGGGVTRFNFGYQRTSPGFEINDLGFLQRADQLQAYGWVGLQYNNPKYFYRRAFMNFNGWQSRNTGKLLLSRGGNINAHAEFNSAWWGHFGFGSDNVGGATYSDRATRGGPALRRSPGYFSWAGVESDPRKAVSFNWFTQISGGDGGRSSFLSVDPSMTVRASSRFSLSAGPSFQRNIDDQQFYDRFDRTDGAHYTFAHLDQKTLGIGTRLNFTATRTLSLQVYAQPFVSSGDFSNLRELDNPRAADYDQRLKAFYTDTNPAVREPPADFSFKQFRQNTVLRWEYRPGSTLFFVWAQGRQDYQDPGTFELNRDYRNLFKAHPDNTFLIKASYWFSL